MSCPRRLKTCSSKFFREFSDGNYICAGILSRKAPGGVAMDCCRLCFTSHYHKTPCVQDATPDEAIMFSLAWGAAAHGFLDGFEPFNAWREENDR